MNEQDKARITGNLTAKGFGATKPKPKTKAKTSRKKKDAEDTMADTPVAEEAEAT